MGVNGTTNGGQINEQIKKLMTDKRGAQRPTLNNVLYGGLLINPTLTSLKKLKRECKTKRKFWIINRDEHWTAIVKKDGKNDQDEWKEIDSFNRDLNGASFKDLCLSKINKQKINETDCGQRTLTKIIMYFEQ